MPDTDIKQIKILVCACVNENKKKEINGVDVIQMSCFTSFYMTKVTVPEVL